MRRPGWGGRGARGLVGPALGIGCGGACAGLNGGCAAARRRRGWRRGRRPQRLPRRRLRRMARAVAARRRGCQRGLFRFLGRRGLWGRGGSPPFCVSGTGGRRPRRGPRKARSPRGRTAYRQTLIIYRCSRGEQVLPERTRTGRENGARAAARAQRAGFLLFQIGGRAGRRPGPGALG
ncbi:MAG: hypothetical protein J3K34DRAFT_126041 [Monoraphidium minutum]|nr:MAG: hypothetical protein J3K34DRAFT_126041 [Monoraphidium minutum]